MVEVTKDDVRSFLEQFHAKMKIFGINEIKSDISSKMPKCAYVIFGNDGYLKKIYSDGVLLEASLPYKSGDINKEILEGRISLGTGAVLIRRTHLETSLLKPSSLVLR